MAETDNLLGKTGAAIKGWFRTLVLMVRDRRALLSHAPVRKPRVLSPVSFLLGGAAVLYAVQNVAALKAPDMELPPAISFLEQAVSALGNITTVVLVAGAVLSSAVIWAMFRLFRLALSWQAAWRHAAYNNGAQCAAILFIAVPQLIWRLTLRPAGMAVQVTGLVGYFICYLFLVVWILRQYADECGVRAWRAAPPLLIALVPLWLLSAVVVDSSPGIWITNVFWMVPGIEPGDTLHVNRWVLAGRDPKPGEVVTLDPLDAGRHWVPSGGAFYTEVRPFTGRVIAVPGDSVAARGADLVVNGEVLARERLRMRTLKDRTDPVGQPIQPFRQRLGEHSFVVSYGPEETPRPCLPEKPVELPADRFLVAFDERLDGNIYCAVFARGQFSGVVDWDLRTKAVP